MSIIDTIAALPLPVLNHWGYFIVFFAALIEALPLVGSFIPGQTIVVLAGFFAKLNILDIGDVIWVAALGAILGDLIGYSLGRKYGYSLINTYGKYFLVKKTHFKKMRDLVKNHTGKTLTLGRFNSITRSFSPFIAGAAELPFLKFMYYNIAGGIVWAGSFAILGYIFGHSFERVSAMASRVLLAVIVIAILAFVSYELLSKKKRKI